MFMFSCELLTIHCERKRSLLTASSFLSWAIDRKTTIIAREKKCPTLFDARQFTTVAILVTGFTGPGMIIDILP